jgi:hypothetical protein
MTEESRIQKIGDSAEAPISLQESGFAEFGSPTVFRIPPPLSWLKVFRDGA